MARRVSDALTTSRRATKGPSPRPGVRSCCVDEPSFVPDQADHVAGRVDQARLAPEPALVGRRRSEQVMRAGLTASLLRLCQAAVSSCHPGKTRTAGWQRKAVPSILARSTPRLTRPFSMLEMVVCGMPHSAESWVWLRPCNSRMIRTDSPGVTSMRFLAGMSLCISALPIVMWSDANDLNGHDVSLYRVPRQLWAMLAHDVDYDPSASLHHPMSRHGVARSANEPAPA